MHNQFSFKLPQFAYKMRSLLLLTAISCMAVTASAEEKPADQLEKLTVDGRERTMLVYAPGDAPLGKVYEFLKHADKGILNWYVFSE